MEQNNDWIKVSDKMPEYAERVLVCANGIIYIGYVDHKTRLDGRWMVAGEFRTEKVTHWQPLPKLPK